MARFSETSRARLAQCDGRLRRLFEFVIERVDCTIFTGYRGEAEQEEMFRTGRSKARFGASPHNREPSMAVDAAPYPIDWKDRERATLFAGYVLGVAAGMGIRLRWGGDWDNDFQVSDNSFDDLWHFEIMEGK